MIKIYVIILQSIALTFAMTARGQGAFQNLDFEAATISLDQAPGPVSTTDALPGWNAYFYEGSSLADPILVAQAQVGFNTVNPTQFQVPQISLVGANGPAIKSIDGNFSVFLEEELLPGYGINAVAISQTGLVPADAKSILFKAQPGTLPLQLSLGGQNIPFVALGTGSNYTLYGGNVSAFAGQTLSLVFESLPLELTPDPTRTGWNLDSIEFSTQPIPEPSTLVLNGFVIGLMAIIIFARMAVYKTMYKRW